MQFNNVSLSFDNQDAILKESYLHLSPNIKFQVHNIGVYNFAPIRTVNNFELENDQLFKKYEQAWRELADL